MFDLPISMWSDPDKNFQSYNQIRIYDTDPINQKFTRKELDKVIKSMQKEKSTGPDELFNELIIYSENNKSKMIEIMKDTS